MAAHTLGPWCIDPEYDHEQVTGPDGITVADCLIVAPRGGPSLERIRANARLIAAAPNLRDVAEALILFHSGDPWDETKRLRWLQLTGADEATTKTLCDLARAAIAKVEDTA